MKRIIFSIVFGIALLFTAEAQEKTLITNVDVWDGERDRLLTDYQVLEDLRSWELDGVIKSIRKNDGS